ncbi:hypothetical protein DC522_01590 [Microvirga sp. KLBC 81]|uniref:hypothetical protein n=1 Tax=Microvirga sp. KLBC 81 TaxID=1862707 RepID=UPI000D50B90A|nr:hypothetical protein [Microvirga sp. KLBC 81]PVE25959.1 hypothetical protein DC522_01590 [Microvirga sp. KLBC 81]
MPQSCSKNPDDLFDGLRLPVSAWKALEDAHITSLKQLKALAHRIEQIRSIDSETAQVIKDRLDRMSARRRVHVRLVFPKQTHRQKGMQEVD